MENQRELHLFRQFSRQHPGRRRWEMGGQLEGEELLPGRSAQHTFTLFNTFGRFLVVGGIGVIVNNGALFILYQLAHMPLVVASILAIGLAITGNYLLNDWWTFHQASRSATRFARFSLVSLGGLAITTLTLWLLATWFSVPYMAANLVGIGLATTWNFGANLLWTWG